MWAIYIYLCSACSVSKINTLTQTFFQMTVSNSFSSVKNYLLWFNLSWSLFLICNVNPDLLHLIASLGHNVFILTRVFQANYANISAARSSAATILKGMWNGNVLRSLSSGKQQTWKCAIFMEYYEMQILVSVSSKICAGFTGPWKIWLQSQISKFQTRFIDKYLKYFLWNCYQVNATTPHWSLVNIGSGNGLVPSGNKPLHEPMLTYIPVAIWHH